MSCQTSSSFSSSFSQTFVVGGGGVSFTSSIKSNTSLSVATSILINFSMQKKEKSLTLSIYNHTSRDLNLPSGTHTCPSSIHTDTDPPDKLHFLLDQSQRMTQNIFIFLFLFFNNHLQFLFTNFIN